MRSKPIQSTCCVPATRLFRWLLIGGLLFSVGCEEPPRNVAPSAAKPPAWFEDITTPAGVAFIHEAEVSGKYLFSESVGSGGALFDFDNDGNLDVFLIHNVNPSAAATNRLFHQEAEGQFRDVSIGSGLESPGYGNGLAVGDVNNDGLPEVLITEYDRVRLFLNLGEGKFRDVTAQAGVTNRNWSVPAAFVDYDRDGWLDLVVGNYVDFDPTQRCPDAKGQPDFCGPHGFPATITRLFRNLGVGAGEKQPRFEDVSVRSGVARAPGKAMEIVCADFDGDHWPDIFITDDGLPNRLFMNQQNGTFKEQAVARGIAFTGTGASAANMGVALGDIDDDGLFDLFVPHLAEENHTLWRQGPRGLFQDYTARAGLLSMPGHGTGFAAVFADFDCDGTLDLAVANGLVRRHRGNARPRLAANIAPFWQPYAEPSQLFAGMTGGKFHEISSDNAALCADALVGRGMACGDIDNDGRPDLLLTSLGGPSRLLRNVAGSKAGSRSLIDKGSSTKANSESGSHWLGVRATDPAHGNRDAYGAEVVVRAGGRMWWRLVQSAYSYASSNDPRVHFGLGPASSVDSVQIRWPDGSLEGFSVSWVDRYVDLRKGEGKMIEP